jgi:CCR4-NOT transcription complex subunit 6
MDKRQDNASQKADSEDGASQADHPSSTAAPVNGAKAPRPTANTKPDSSWVTLDMGGMRLKNLSTAIFNFNYLTTLYINHNQISTLSPEISRLRHLVLLDMSGNQLSSVPPALGMCTSLRELYLFDNHIDNLPPELGSLHQLEMLGLEGNPIQGQLRAIIQKDGTAALIAYLRDSCPVPQPPPERTWKFLQTQADRDVQDADPSIETFSLLCYNVLCEKAATTSMYGYTPSWALLWDYRKELILTEIINYEADFLCLQVRSAPQLDQCIVDEW